MPKQPKPKEYDGYDFVECPECDFRCAPDAEECPACGCEFA